MLFHITAGHDRVTCPRKDPARGPVRRFVEASGVKIIGAWVDAPSHTISVRLK